jgi:hypothetical protein
VYLADAADRDTRNEVEFESGKRVRVEIKRQDQGQG